MSNLLKRFLTGVLAGGLSVTIIIAHPIGHYIFCFVVSLLGLLEFYRMTGLVKKPAAVLTFGLAIITWAYFIVYFIPLNSFQFQFVEYVETNWVILFMGALGSISISVLFAKKEENVVRTMGLTFMGFFYVFLPIVVFFIYSLSPWVRTEIGSFEVMADTYDFRLPLGLLFLHWMLDVMAYFGGKFLGKRPLFERISPKKTWEGAIVGAMFCIGFGVVLDQWFPQKFYWVIVAVIVSILSQVGDLVESMYKRSMDIKDSGGVLPGHGGIMDRFDGMYLTVPVVYLYHSAIYALAH